MASATLLLLLVVVVVVLLVPCAAAAAVAFLSARCSASTALSNKGTKICGSGGSNVKVEKGREDADCVDVAKVDVDAGACNIPI